MAGGTRMVTLRVLRGLHRRLEAARAGTTLTETLLRSLRAGFEIWRNGSRPSGTADGPPFGKGPCVRVAFLCPDLLLLEVKRVHADMRARWPTMKLTDVTVGLLHMGVGADR